MANKNKHRWIDYLALYFCLVMAIASTGRESLLASALFILATIVLSYKIILSADDYYEDDNDDNDSDNQDKQER